MAFSNNIGMVTYTTHCQRKPHSLYRRNNHEDRRGPPPPTFDNEHKLNEMPSQNLADLKLQIRPTSGFLLRPKRIAKIVGLRWSALPQPQLDLNGKEGKDRGGQVAPQERMTMHRSRRRDVNSAKG